MKHWRANANLLRRDQRFVASPDFSALGGSRPPLEFGCGESIGSSRVVGVALPSSAGIGGSAGVFGFGAASVEVLAAPDTISRFVMLEKTSLDAGGKLSFAAPVCSNVTATARLRLSLSRKRERNLRILAKVVKG